MEKKYDEIWAISPNSAHNASLESRKNGEDEDDEALSLSDLPLIHQGRKEEERESISPHERETTTKAQDDFDFCSLSKESEMCAADEVFFQGQILPLGRHSVSSDKGYPDNPRPSISRSESMDHYRSAVGFISSRSSSISSHQSSSSSGASSSATVRRPKLPPTAHNQFHSHPSPSPRLQHSNRPPTIGTNHRRSVSNKSSVWKVLRLGLVATPPEIAFQDLKTRSSNSGTNCRNFGSRNSTSSNSSGNSERKKKARGGLLMSGCNCSVDAVDTVASRVVFMKRSASESEFEVEKEKLEEAKPARKKVLSHHRTFEWLKQLSIEGAADG